MVAFYSELGSTQLRRKVFVWTAIHNEYGMVDEDSVRAKSSAVHFKIDVDDNGTLELSTERDRQFAPSKPVAAVTFSEHIPNKEPIFHERARNHHMVEVDMKKEFQIELESWKRHYGERKCDF